MPHDCWDLVVIGGFWLAAVVVIVCACVDAAKGDRDDAERNVRSSGGWKL